MFHPMWRHRNCIEPYCCDFVFCLSPYNANAKAAISANTLTWSFICLGKLCLGAYPATLLQRYLNMTVNTFLKL